MTTETDTLPGIAPGGGAEIARDILLERAQDAIAFQAGRAETAEAELDALADALGKALAEAGRLRALLADQGRADEAKEFLTPAEAALRLQVDPKTVRRCEVTGQLAPVRTLGGHRRYRATEVEALRVKRQGAQA